MAGPDDIIVNIAVQAGDDGSLKNIVEEAKRSLEGLGEAFGAVGEAAAAFGVIALGVGVAIGEWAKHASEAVTEMSHLAAQAGTTVTEMSSLEGAFASMGVNTDSMGSAFKRLAVQIEQQWGQIKKSTRDAADVTINDMLGIESATLNVQKAQAGLVTAQQKLRELTTGETVSPEVAKAQQIKAAMLAVEEAELHVQEATQKRAEAAKKANEDHKNSIEALSGAIQSVANGQATFAEASKGANLELQNVIKGLVAASGAGESAASGLEGFTGSISDVANQAPKALEVFYKLSDFMKNSGDASLNTAVAFRLFGRGVRADMIEALSEGSDALKAHQKHLEEVGLTYNKTDEEIAKGLHKASAALSYDLSTTSNQIGLLFAPAFTDAAKNFTDAIEHAHASIIQFATAVANQVNPVISDFFKLLSGDDSFTSKFSQTFAIIQDIGKVVASILGPAFSFIGGLIGDMVEKFNVWLGNIRTAIVGLEAVGKAVGAVITLLLNRDVDKFKETLDAILKDADAKAAKIGAQVRGEKPDGEKKPDEGHAPAAPTGADLASSFQKVTVPTEDGGSVEMTVNKQTSKPLGGTEKYTPPTSGSPTAKAPTPAPNAKVVTVSGTPDAVAHQKRIDLETKEGGEGAQSYGKPLSERYNEDGTPKKQPLTDSDREPLGPLPSPTASESEYQAWYKRSLPFPGQASGPEIPAPPPKPPNEFVPGSGADRFSQLNILDALKSALPGAAALVANPGKETGLDGVVQAIKDLLGPGKTGSGGDDEAKQGISDLGTAAGETGSYMDSLKTQVGSLSEAIGSAINSINGALSQLAARGGKNNEEDPQGLAEGGHVRGAGTETSDSIRANLSHNEFVQPSKATHHYGLGFMESVRNLTFPKNFSLGGLANAFADSMAMQPVQSFASGGPAVASAPAAILAGHHTIDLRTNHGTYRVLAPSSTVETMKNDAVRNQLSSQGRKPGWYE